MLLPWLSCCAALLLHIQVSSAQDSNATAVEWSTYRPNLYFGLKPRLPESLLTGLIWHGTQSLPALARVRHSCEQDDGVTSYNYLKHDGRSFAIQEIVDGSNNVKLTTSLLKVPSGQFGGSWGVRIEGAPIDPSKVSRISLMHYAALEGLGSITMDTSEQEEGLEGEVKFSGSTPQLGDFTLRVQEVSSEGPVTPGKHANDFADRLDRMHFTGINTGAGQAWRAKDFILNQANERFKPILDKYGQQDLPDPALLLSLTNEVAYGSNLFAIQKTYEGAFKLDVYFDSGSPGSALDAPSLTAGLQASASAYDQRFEQLFSLSSKGFTSDQIDFARQMTASTIGGIGYFYGPAIVDRGMAYDYDDLAELDVRGGQTRTPNPQLTEPMELLTATPSRPFFPRGFYWDEGFHLALIGAWDNDLSLDILSSWMNLVDESGWIAREQILGEEPRSKVPKEFWTQYPQNANPPTIAMAVTSFIRRLKEAQPDIDMADLSLDAQQHAMLHNIGSSADPAALADRHLQDPALARAYLASVYPKLRKHYLWFRETQRGQVSEWGRQARSRSEGYRWRGRTADHVLTSGLDDYPRAKVPHVGELHLDLACWMAFFTRTMCEIAEHTGEEEDMEEYEHTYQAILNNIEDLHWSEEDQMYCDASIDENEENYFICHKGYITIFPLALGLLKPESQHLKALLDLIHDPEQLWSPYGILSLSKADPFFGQGENYWRGPIWMQVNYLVLQSLHTFYIHQPGPYQEQAAQVYSELRDNLINNVYKSFKETGTSWEQFNPHTGAGQRSRPFTGWTALVVNIMAEQYS